MNLVVALLVFAPAVKSAQNQNLLGADEVLKRLKSAETSYLKSMNEEMGSYQDEGYGKYIKFQKKLNEFGDSMKSLPPRTAAAQWVGLLDESLTLELPMYSLVQYLPSPESWEYIRPAMKARMEKKTSIKGVGLNVFGTFLGNDASAQAEVIDKSITILSASKDKLAPIAIDSLNQLKLLSFSSGKAQNTKKAVLDAAKNPNAKVNLTAELFAALGSEKESFLTELFRTSKAPIVYSNYGTLGPIEEMLNKIVIRTAGDHKAPHWGAIHNFGNKDAYEAIAKKFNPYKPWPATAKKGSASTSDGMAARGYYLYALAKSGAVARAVQGAGDGNILKSISQFHELLADKNVNEFLRQVLVANSTADLWDQYSASSMLIGKMDQVLVTTDEVLKRKNLAEGAKVSVLTSRESALLFFDRVNEAVAVMKARHVIESKKYSGYSGYYSAITRLERIALLLEDKALIAEVQRMKTALHSEEDQPEKSGSLVEREMAVAETSGAELSYSGDNIGAELISIYSEAGRPADVVKVAEAAIWESDDLSQVSEVMRFMGEEAQQLAINLAKALNKVGRKEEAHQIALQLIKAKPGEDAGYEFLLSLNSPQIMSDLDQMYSANPYEERPLIWKAKLLFDQGKLDEAETVIKEAIAVDPSDGEQHNGRRMYVYTVYADILAKKGDADQSELYRSAVRAIRIAEKADQLLEAGLVKRAIKKYDDALSVFSDAYCIQSRLAIYLAQSGRMDEAVVHYRRAYELMADSFGYVETHCFGCELAFEGETQQQIAEEVFNRIAHERPNKPQIHYLLGYLRETQGRLDEAVTHYKRAVELDSKYLNAWRRLGQVGEGILSAEELKQISAQLAKIDPSKEEQLLQLYSSLETSSFEQAYRLGESLSKKSASVFKLKKNALVSGEMSGWSSVSVQNRPSQYLMSTGIYRLISPMIQ
ncbi:MAG: tetratricopeptide repeat protein [Fimbriimonadaceae bacterium]|nr:MAG: tetratricopeptide repeat protein [Fimbriimonadaceae bacterium]